MKSHKFITFGSAVTVGDDACLPQGNCTKTSFVGQYELYDKTYSLEDSIQLRALTVLASKMLSGSYMTIQPDVKAGTRKPLWRDDFDVEYNSEATGGKGENDCGPFSPAGGIIEQTNKSLHTFYLSTEVSLCYKKLIGTFMQSILNSGARLSEANTALNDRLLRKIIEKNNIQTDTLIWHGDQGSAKKYIAHYDGLIKKAAQAIGATAPHKIQLVFAGVAAADYIEGRVGGQTFKTAFDTNMVTTVTNWVTTVSGYTDSMTGSALYTVSFDGVDTVTVTSNIDNAQVELTIAITDGTGLDSCDDANTAGTGTVVETEVDEYTWSDEPMTIDYVPITSANVIGEINKVFLKIAEQKPYLLSDPNFHIHVSSHVWAALQSAQTQLTGQFKNINDIAQVKPFNLRIVEQPYLVGNVIFGASRSNLFFGTDLISDIGNADQWVDKDCQEVRFRCESAQGVQVDRFDEVITNLKGHPFTFQAAQTEVPGFTKNV